MVECDGKIYKIITDVTENLQLQKLRHQVYSFQHASKRTPPCHFVVPIETCTRTVFSYKKVPYGPLNRVQAHKSLKTLSAKICAALEELHGFGSAHGDVRLPNVCFNSSYEAVLLDMERGTDNLETEESPLCIKLGDTSCMYRKPKTIKGILTGKRLDYMQLGWLLVWVLNCTGDYHEREWEKQPHNIVKDVFLTRLVRVPRCVLKRGTRVITGPW